MRIARLATLLVAVGFALGSMAPAGAAVGTFSFTGSYATTTAPSNPTTCATPSSDFRFGYTLTDQAAHTWTLTGYGCQRIQGCKRTCTHYKGLFRLVRQDSTLPALTGHFTGVHNGVGTDLKFKVQKEDPKRPRQKAKGVFHVTDNCSEGFCAQGFSGSLTVDPAYFS